MIGTVGRPGTGIYLHDVGGRKPPQIQDRMSVCSAVAVSSRSKPFEQWAFEGQGRLGNCTGQGKTWAWARWVPAARRQRLLAA
jgi:hypothetical protein